MVLTMSLTQSPADIPGGPMALGRKELKEASCALSRKYPQMTHVEGLVPAAGAILVDSVSFKRL